MWAGSSTTRQSYAGPGFGTCLPTEVSPRNLIGGSPVLGANSATRQSYPGFGPDHAATNGTWPLQVLPADSPWNSLPVAAPLCYNFGPRVLPPPQMGRLHMPGDSATAMPTPREMLNFSFYQNRIMVNFWLIIEYIHIWEFASSLHIFLAWTNFHSSVSGWLPL